MVKKSLLTIVAISFCFNCFSANDNKPENAGKTIEKYLSSIKPGTKITRLDWTGKLPGIPNKKEYVITTNGKKSAALPYVSVQKGGIMLGVLIPVNF